jgi:hypothetical protein
MMEKLGGVPRVGVEDSTRISRSAYFTPTWAVGSTPGSRTRCGESTGVENGGRLPGILLHSEYLSYERIMLKG